MPKSATRQMFSRLKEEELQGYLDRIKLLEKRLEISEKSYAELAKINDRIIESEHRFKEQCKYQSQMIEFLKGDNSSMARELSSLRRALVLFSENTIDTPKRIL